MTTIDDLILDHLDIVRPTIRRKWGKSLKYHDFEDLVQEGVLGLVDAANKYNPNKGTKFSTYANIRILGAALDKASIDTGLKRKYYFPIHLYGDEQHDYNINSNPSHEIYWIEYKCRLLVDSIKDRLRKLFYYNVVDLIYYRYVDNLSNCQIGNILGVTGSAISKRITPHITENTKEQVYNIVLECIADIV